MFKSKKGHRNLINIARENQKSYPKRQFKALVEKVDFRIEQGSLAGSKGTHLKITDQVNSCIDDLKDHYEKQGFDVEIARKEMWIWWGK